MHVLFHVFQMTYLRKRHLENYQERRYISHECSNQFRAIGLTAKYLLILLELIAENSNMIIVRKEKEKNKKKIIIRGTFGVNISTSVLNVYGFCVFYHTF